MEFPKALMSITELTQMGFSEYKLRAIAQAQGYPLVIRENTNKTSKLKFDTKELNAYLKKTTQKMERR